MRIALAMYGLPGGSAGRDGAGDWLEPVASYENYLRVAFADCDVDFFCHTWETPVSEDLMQVYRPVRGRIDTAVECPYCLSDFRLDDIDSYAGICRASDRPSDVLRALLKRAYSRWSSTSRVLALVREHTKYSSIQYDWIVLLRYDLEFRTGLNLAKLPTGVDAVVPRRKREREMAYDDHFVCLRPSSVSAMEGLESSMRQLSIRPPVALKRALTSGNVNVFEHLENGVDFCLRRDLQRVEESRQTVSPFSRALKRFRHR